MPLPAIDGLPALDIPPAPPILRPAAIPVRRPKAPAAALLLLGAALVLGPVVGGFFSTAASGRQLLDAFRPHLQADALARYEQDLRTLRAGSAAVDVVYDRERVQQGRFPGIDVYRQQSAEINDRASTLLQQVEAAEPSFREVDAIGGFERVPFLVVAAGLAALYGAGVLLAGSNRGARAATPLVVLAAAALVAYPFLSDLPSGSRAGHQMVTSLAPVMTHAQVAQLQQDFVVLVTAEGQLDTSFRPVSKPAAAAAVLSGLGNEWPTISSDLATLVGTINDNITNYQALQDLDRLTRPVGLSGLTALPWVLVGVGIAGAGLATAARPRRRKEQL